MVPGTRYLIFQSFTYQIAWEVLKLCVSTYQKACVFKHFQKIPIKRYVFMTHGQLIAWFLRG